MFDLWMSVLLLLAFTTGMAMGHLFTLPAVRHWRGKYDKLYRDWKLDY